MKSQEIQQQISTLLVKLQGAYNQINEYFSQSPNKSISESSIMYEESQEEILEQKEEIIQHSQQSQDNYLQRMANKRKQRREKKQIKTSEQIKQQINKIENEFNCNDEINSQDLDRIFLSRRKVTLEDIVLEEYDRQKDPNFYNSFPDLKKYVQRVKRSRILKK